ncbi:MAG: hypothetical protein M0009_15280 [Deltaproteobacteria bacterium]|nr:hypothetical protein [Deltaproteobacteria bacterium]
MSGQPLLFCCWGNGFPALCRTPSDRSGKRTMNLFYGRKRTKTRFSRRQRLWLPALLLLLALFPTPGTAEENPWSAELQVKRYFGSHTSYEFGNPYPPYQAPLSRLEFPLNTWWVGGEFRRRFSRISLGVEILRNGSKESDGSFKDSDWDDDGRPDVKTIYSESQCRLEPSYMVRGDADLKVADWLGLPVWLDLRPVIGIRWQQVELVAHNGVQTYPADPFPPDPLPGDAIRFQQTYWQYFLGIRSAYELGRHLRIPGLTLFGQLDWAYVEGDNSDRHLLRAGNRWTYEKTSGDGWHASLGLKAALARNISVGLEADYLRIRTQGSHRWVHDVINADMTWDHGVKVWSDQTSLTTRLEYRF